MKRYFNYLKKICLVFFILVLNFSCNPEIADDPVPADAPSLDSESGLMAFAKETSALQNKINAEIRKATARYHRVEVAEADGYVQASECVSSPLGGMGYHYLNEEYLNDGVIDPSKPDFILYEPMKNGKLRLVGVEFVVIAAQWDANNDAPPMLGNQILEDRRGPGFGGAPFPNYQIHAWIWKNNPAGIYTAFNPNVTCEFSN